MSSRKSDRPGPDYTPRFLSNHPGQEEGWDQSPGIARSQADGNDERATLSIPEAARLIGISRNAAYAAARAGTIPVWKIGARYLVLRRPLEAMLAGEAVAIGR